jgi:hypothetical protein
MSLLRHAFIMMAGERPGVLLAVLMILACCG